MIPVFESSATQTTVLMTVYQTPVHYLRQAVESILCQTEHDFIFMILLDGYHQHEQLRCIAEYDDGRLWVEQIEHVGLTEALNVGLREITTPFIMRQDADDYSSPLRLRAMLKGMEDSSIGALGDNYAVVSETGKLMRINTANPEDVPPDRYKSHGLAGTLAGAGSMLRTSGVKQVGGWKYPVAQDCYMMHALKAKGWRIVSLRNTYYYWRQVPTSISHTRKAEQQMCVQAILQEFPPQ